MNEIEDPVMRTDREQLLPSEFSNPISEIVDEEARAKLRRYFDLAWRIFERLEKEGTLDAFNLTGPEVNPTVKPSKPSGH